MEQLSSIKTVKGREYEAWATPTSLQSLNKHYTLNQTVQTITTNTTVEADGFGGWSVMNNGNTTVTINNVTLDPNGNILGLDYTGLQPNVVWGDDLVITFGSGTNPSLTIIKNYYTED